MRTSRGVGTAMLCMAALLFGFMTNGTGRAVDVPSPLTVTNTGTIGQVSSISASGNTGNTTINYVGGGSATYNGWATNWQVSITNGGSGSGTFGETGGSGTLNITGTGAGGTLAANANTIGTVAVNLSQNGTIGGGTLTMASGSFSMSGGTMNGSVSSTNVNVSVTGGTLANNAAFNNSGAGTVAINGWISSSTNNSWTTGSGAVTISNSTLGADNSVTTGNGAVNVSTVNFGANNSVTTDGGNITTSNVTAGNNFTLSGTSTVNTTNITMTGTNTYTGSSSITTNNGTVSINTSSGSSDFQGDAAISGTGNVSVGNMGNQTTFGGSTNSITSANGNVNLTNNHFTNTSGTTNISADGTFNGSGNTFAGALLTLGANVINHTGDIWTAASVMETALTGMSITGGNFNNDAATVYMTTNTGNLTLNNTTVSNVVSGRKVFESGSAGTISVINGSTIGTGVEFMSGGAAFANQDAFYVNGSTLQDGVKFTATGAGNLTYNNADIKNNHEASTTGGDITVSGSTVLDNLKLTSDASGDVLLSNSSFGDAALIETGATSGGGSLMATNVTAGDNFTMSSGGHGAITISNSTPPVSPATTHYGNNAKFVSGGGNINVTGTHFGTGLNINNNSDNTTTTIGTGTVTLTNAVFTGTADILTGGGDMNATGINAGGVFNLTSIDAGSATIINSTFATTTTITTAADNLTSRNVTAGDDFTMTSAGSGDVLAENSSFGARAAFSTGAGSLTSRNVTAGDDFTMTSGGTGAIDITNSAPPVAPATTHYGNNAKFVSGGGNINVTGTHFGAGLNINNNSDNTTTTVGTGTVTLTNAVFTGTADILTGGGDMNATGINAGGVFNLTSIDAGAATIANSTFAAMTTITTAAGNLTASGVTAGDDYTMTSVGSGRIRVEESDFGARAVFSTGEGNIDITDVTAGSDFKAESLGIGNISITGVNITSTFGDYSEIYNTGSGNVKVENAGFGRDNKIHTDAGNVTLIDVTARDYFEAYSLAGGNIEIIGANITSTFGDYTQIHNAGSGSITAANAQFGGDSLLHTDAGDITLTNVVAGSRFLAESLGDGDITVSGTRTGNTTTTRLGDDAQIYNTGSGSIEVSQIEAGRNFDLHTDSGDVTLAGSTFGVGSMVKATLAATGQGDITASAMNVGNSFDWFTRDGDVAIGDSRFGNNGKITSDTGGLSVVNSEIGTNSTFAASPSATGPASGDILVDNSTIGSGFNWHRNEGDVTVRNNSVLGANGSILTEDGAIRLTDSEIAWDRGTKTTIVTNQGNVYIDQMLIGVNSEVRTDGGSDNRWSLNGANTNVLGTLFQQGDKDTVDINDGHYALMQNTVGDVIYNVRGGHTEKIENIAAAPAAGTKANYNLYAHKNPAVADAADAADQVVKEIIGHTDPNVKDTTTVVGGARYTNKDTIETDSKFLNAYINRIVEQEETILLAGTEGARTGLEIGVLNLNEDAELDSDKVAVGSYADLFIHASVTNPVENAITDLYTSGPNAVVWLDRSTVGTQNAAATVTISSRSMLTGFIGNDSSAGPNVYGDVYLETGAVIKPYSIEHQLPRYVSDPGSVYPDRSGKEFRVESTNNTNGTVYWEGSSILSTRLFADQYLAKGATNNQGEQVDLYNTDWVGSVNSTFLGQAKYDPVFGNAYEIAEKRAFNLYTGNGNENTYYFNVVRTDNPIVDGGGTLIVDGNLAFDKNIIKSDMLGEWMFEVGEGGKDVLLRFRLLAAHPSQGGLAKDAVTPNSRAAAAVHDAWRYPYATDFSDINTTPDPSLTDDPNNPYRYAGYNGNMDEFYRANQGVYTNYKQEWVLDFQDYLLELQSEIKDGVDIERSTRLTHPESYASLSNINLNTMDIFINARERSSISNLFQVENLIYEEALAQVEGREAYASINDACPDVGMFVTNPLRFWAAGLGGKGNQSRNGTEYGIDTRVKGGAIGAVKEYGDWYFGLTGGYSHGKSDFDELQSSAKTDAYMAEALVGLRRGLGFIEVYGNYGYFDQSMTRDVAIAGYSLKASGDYHDNVYGGGLRLGYQCVLGDKWLLVPTIGLNYMKTVNSAFSERGRANGSLLLKFGGGDIERETYKVPIMLRLSRAFAFCDFVVMPEVRAAFTPIFGDRYGKATAEYVGNPMPGQYFTAQGIDQGAYAGQLGATLEVSRRGRFYVAANYDYTFRKKSYEHNYSLQAGMNF